MISRIPKLMNLLTNQNKSCCFFVETIWLVEICALEFVKLCGEHCCMGCSVILNDFNLFEIKKSCVYFRILLTWPNLIICSSVRIVKWNNCFCWKNLLFFVWNIWVMSHAEKMENPKLKKFVLNSAQIFLKSK